MRRRQRRGSGDPRLTGAKMEIGVREFLGAAMANRGNPDIQLQENAMPENARRLGSRHADGNLLADQLLSRCSADDAAPDPNSRSASRGAAATVWHARLAK
jgi:hypothetical protein